MKKNEVANIHFITVGNQMFWRYYDVDRDCFKVFLKTPVGKKILLQSENFFLIGDEIGKISLFEIKNFVPVLVGASFSCFSIHISYTEYDNVLGQQEHKIYKICSDTPEICSCVLIYGSKLYYVKKFYPFEQREDCFVDRIDLMNGKTIEIIRPYEFDDSGNCFSTTFYVSEK